ncbi:MAG TPA: glycosyltransferase family 2 protein [Ktedonobacterales bacterium]|nr:glycosyltransferase family 2 protein [Ktedonobacterales bacterium]
MRLIALAMVKNECDIIESFVRHNLRYLDALFIIDNQSVDGTREILVELQREGLPVVLYDDPRFGYFQSEKMTAFYRNVCDYAAPDYVIPLDADEFLAIPTRAALEEALAGLPTGEHGLIAWKTYLFSPNASEPDPVRRMTRRRKAEKPAYYKVVIAADPQENHKLTIAQGNHTVTHSERGELPHHILPGAAVAHYPVRGEAQVIAKAVTGWLAYVAKDPDSAAKDAGYQWHSLYLRLMENPHLTVPELSDLSMRYAQLDPPPANAYTESVVYEPLAVAHTLRYRRHATPHPLVSVARTMERFFQPPLRVPFAEASAREAGGNPQQVYGAWGADFHQEHLFLDLPPFHYLAEKYQPRAVADIGCGLGGYLRMFQEWGATQALGVDGFPASELFLSPGNYVSHDLSQPLDTGRSFDLVICTEVAEHIDERYEDVVVETIRRHARELILFSAAEPNQPGIGHVNCQPLSHWLAKWRAVGWVPDVFDSLALRSLSTFSWFRRNLVVLKPIGQTASASPAFDERDLERLAATPWTWYGQDPHIYTFPFSEPLPSVFVGGQA